MTRTTWTAAVILVGTIAASSAALGEVEGKAAPAARLVSLTSSPGSGAEEVMFSVPQNSRLLVTQACVQHTAMVIAIGDHEDRLTYGTRGCTSFQPGFVVAGGQNVYCDNGSGIERSCALVGVLETMPAQKGSRVRFYDLRRR